jgi:hypothetical protein
MEIGILRAAGSLRRLSWNRRKCTRQLPVQVGQIALMPAEHPVPLLMDVLRKRAVVVVQKPSVEREHRFRMRDRALLDRDVTGLRELLEVVLRGQPLDLLFLSLFDRSAGLQGDVEFRRLGSGATHQERQQQADGS